MTDDLIGFVESVLGAARAGGGKPSAAKVSRAHKHAANSGQRAIKLGQAAIKAAKKVSPKATSAEKAAAKKKLALAQKVVASGRKALAAAARLDRASKAQGKAGKPQPTHKGKAVPGGTGAGTTTGPSHGLPGHMTTRKSDWGALAQPTISLPHVTKTTPLPSILTRKVALPIRKPTLIGGLVARGREQLANPGSVLTSMIPGVSDEAWTKFVRVMRTAEPKSISASNAVGMFELMPRRLADLGLVENLARKQLSSGRIGWVYAFVPPLTAEQFLGSALVQYRVFCESMKNYVERIDAGEIEMPAAMSLSGALAVLHRAGPQGLRSNEQFPSTRALYARAKDIF